MLIRRYSNKAVDIDAIESEIKELSIPYDYDTKEYPIEVVLQKFRTGEIVIPDYQRDLEWGNDMRSRFIESLFLGVPVPPIFVAILDNGNLEIIDGLQRIGTIDQYQNDKLQLRTLEEIKSLNGTRYRDIHPYRQRKFLLLTLRFLVVTSKADLAIRADIFDRLNSSGKKLLPAQIRKGAFATNPFYIFIQEMAASTEFGRVYKGKREAEEDKELVLRYFAYAEDYLDFKHDVSIFLNRYVEQKGHSFTKDEADEKRTEFFSMLSFVAHHFPFGFTKEANAKATPRVRFEAISVGSHLALERNPDLVPPSMRWLNSKEFKQITTSDASNNPGRLVARVEFVRDCLLGIKTENDLHFN